MTAATLTHLPLAAGSAVATLAGRAALKALGYYMRAPLTNTAILAMAGLTLTAASNALYFQTGMHPAPFYAPDRVASAAAPATPEALPVLEPVQRTAMPAQPATPAPAVTATQSASADQRPVGNEDVAEVQRKLMALGYFEGTVDGYYGPKTASAIRAFETERGMRPLGALNREVVTAILAATPGQQVAQPAPIRPVEPEVEPAQLMNYAQLTPSVPVPETVPVADSEPPVLRRQMPNSPNEALDIAVSTAGEAIDTIVAAVGQVAGQPAPRPAAAAEPIRPAAPIAEARAPVMPVVPAAQPVATVPVTQASAPSQPMPPRPADAAVAEIVTASVAEPAAMQTLAMTTPPAATDQNVVARVQRGLASLGFLHGKADGVAGEATARAIRNFEVYYNYEVTGQVTPELVDLLTAAGAQI
ncbi:hypothetical protein EMQ25_09080 [Arsenicitalea aurantiaca]|uniref:Peptidoglycan binding-like domain-containing protein n=1 Tax=Arsenicitalea aurantiaca TaxID=1783274 RepID=A0A433XAD7_9HYPH|nr:peptidoglycan-binding domain-containing protein [Arsenicitalea aurantiaca]RUT31022.1 hypothetical protein EMQ25_09080 [Arsenicitalea aurantiaca]